MKGEVGEVKAQGDLLLDGVAGVKDEVEEVKAQGDLYSFIDLLWMWYDERAVQRADDIIG